MANEWDSPVVTRSKPRRRWLRWLLWCACGFMLLLVLGYFVATSAWFLKKVVLPRASTALNSSITVSDASISPFRSVTLRNVRVQPRADMEPVAVLGEVVARYSLIDIIGGNINVVQVAVTDPVIELVENEDGTTNLDPLLNRPKSEEPEPEPEGEPSAPPRIAIGVVQINNATLRRVKKLAGAREQVAQVSRLNLTLSDVGNGRSGAFNLSAEASQDERPSGAGPSTNYLQADLAATLAFALGEDLKPQSLSGDFTVSATQLPVALRDYAGAAVALHCQLTPTDLEQFTIDLKQRSRSLGRLSARGPFDLAKQEGAIRIELTGVDRAALGLVGTRLGIDFGDTAISATNEIRLTEGGQVIVAAGGLNVSQLSVRKTGEAASASPAAAPPAIDFRLHYAGGFKRAEQVAELKSFGMTALREGIPFVQGSLTRPAVMALQSSNGVGESAFQLTVTNLNVADWSALVGDYAGLVNANLAVALKDAGQRIEADFVCDMDGIAAPVGTNRFKELGLRLATKAALSQFTNATLGDLRLRLLHRQQQLVETSVTGDYNLGSQEGGAQMKAELALVPLAALAPAPGVAVKAGTLSIAMQAAQRRGTGTNMVQSAVGNLRLAEAGFAAGGVALERFNLGFDWDTSIEASLVTVRKAVVALALADKPGGTVDVNGTYDLATKSADLTVAVKALNEVVVAAAAQPSLGEKKLKALLLNLTSKVRYSPSNESAVAATIDLEQLHIDDPSRGLPNVPFAVDLKVDASLRTNVAVLRDLALNLRVDKVPAASVNTAGEFDLTRKTGRAKVKIVELNENAVRPFAAAALGDKQLKSLSFNADVVAAYDAAGSSSVNGNLSVKNLAVIDPSGALPPDPLAVGLQLDASYGSSVALIRTLQLQLTPTGRAQNLLSVTGRVDMAQSNALKADILLASEALDVTPYYDMFVGRKKTNAPVVAAEPAPAPPPSTTPPPVPKEPDPIALPVDRVTVALNVDRFYLRDISIRDWKAQVIAERSRVELRPFEMVLNGAAVRANTDVNLGVPGYQYVLAFTTERIPVEPIANSFAPEQRGKVRGDLVVDLQVRGAGVTGPNLRTNLSGNFGLNFTNCFMQLTSPRAKKFIAPIAFALNAPELNNSTLNGVFASGRMGLGKVTVQQAVVFGDNFTASTSGDLSIADVLMDSRFESWPLRLSLPRSIVDRLGLASSSSSGSAFADIPDFVHVKGTLAEPDPVLSKAALGRAALGKATEKAKDALLSPFKSSTPSAPSAPAAPSAPSSPSLPGIGLPGK